MDSLRSETPELRGAGIAAVYFAQRDGGDFYDFLRVGQSRVLFGMLDVSGNREQNQRAAASYSLRQKLMSLRR